MSVLQFIASIKWPITVLLLVGFASWRLRRNPELGKTIKKLIASRGVRVSIAGQEFELTAAEDAAAIAAQSDDKLAQVAESKGEDESPSDVAQIRRGAVEAVMTSAAHWGWNMAQMGFRNPPDPSIEWSDDGQPKILFGAATLSKSELINAAAIRRWRLLKEAVRNDPPQPD